MFGVLVFLQMDVGIIFLVHENILIYVFFKLR